MTTDPVWSWVTANMVPLAIIGPIALLLSISYLCRRILYKPCGVRISVSHGVYGVLFGLALIMALISYIKFSREHVAGFSGSMAIIFGVATVFQQGSVYRDIHRMEDGSTEMDREYGDWINMRLERLMRALMMVALLLGTGKIASVVYPVLRCNLPENATLPYCEFFKPDGAHSDAIFEWGSLIVFVSLALWNFFAFAKGAVGLSNYATGSPERRRARLVLIRVALFGISATFGAIYWYTVVTGDVVQIGKVATVLLGAYVSTYVLTVPLQFGRVLDRWAQ